MKVQANRNISKANQQKNVKKAEKPLFKIAAVKANRGVLLEQCCIR
jgi:hypothetical protein